jgi:predicted  nucleic acid-binding Zn-ribbon protein
MQEEETEQLDDIHEEVKGSHAQLGAINERTRNMESKLDDMAGNIDDNEADINELQDSVKRNTTIVTGVTGGISMVLLWISDKVTRVL